VGALFLCVPLQSVFQHQDCDSINVSPWVRDELQSITPPMQGNGTEKIRDNSNTGIFQGFCAMQQKLLSVNYCCE